MLYYWLTSLNKNQTSDILHRDKKNIHLDPSKFLKWLIHNHNISFLGKAILLIHTFVMWSYVDVFFFNSSSTYKYYQ